MTFQSLLVCKDEQATSVLTSVLAGFGLGVQCCGYPDALCRLTEQKFDAVIVDYDDPHSAALVLQNAYQSSTPHKTVTVALLGERPRYAMFWGGREFRSLQTHFPAAGRSQPARCHGPDEARTPPLLPGPGPASRKTSRREWRGDGRHSARPERGRPGCSGGAAAVPVRHHRRPVRAF